MTDFRLLCFLLAILPLVHSKNPSSSSSQTSGSSFSSSSASSDSSSAATAGSSSSSSSSSSFCAFQPHNIMRAWHCHGRNQRELVDRLQQAGIVRSPQVRDVLQQVDRQYYVTLLEPEPQHHHQAAGAGSLNPSPYLDAPQAIGLGQTISAPHMHAHVLEEMLPHLLQQPKQQPVASTSSSSEATSSSSSTTSSIAPLRVLDVGCGSGYLTACLGRWFQPRLSSTTSSPTENELWKYSIMGRPGRVFGIDIYPHLVNLTKENILKHDGDLLQTGVVQVKVGNGWLGLPSEGPFDAIHVGAAASEFPQQLALQLKVGGVLIVPVGPVGGVQNLYKVERVAGDSGGGGSRSSTRFVQSDFNVKELLGVRYVPLVQQPGVDDL